MKVIVSLKGSVKQLAKVPAESQEAFLYWMTQPHGGCVRFSRQGTPIAYKGEKGKYDWFFPKQLKVVMK